jgi:hypothetical protein
MVLRVFESKVVDERAFVAFWSRRYQYPRPALYIDNIGRPLTEQAVWDLYTWKNGSEMSARKRQSVRQHYIAKLHDQAPLDTIQHGCEYVRTLGGGAIWNLFWLHCRKPDIFPIFDQHTYRAMASIAGLPEGEIPIGGAEKIGFYFEMYLPFLERFRPLEFRAVDQSLFAYGQFLKSSFRLEWQ